MGCMSFGLTKGRAPEMDVHVGKDAESACSYAQIARNLLKILNPYTPHMRYVFSLEFPMPSKAFAHDI